MPKIKTSRNRKTCSVFGCMNSNLQNPEMAFFSLPSNPQRLSSWLSLMDREDLANKPERHYRVCETHFDRGCILLTSNRKVLKKNALPSLQLPATARLEKGVQTPRALMPVVFTLKPEAVRDASSLLDSDDIGESTPLYCDPGTAERGRGQLLDAAGNTVGRVQDGFQCNLCSADIFGFRYTCVQCADYDLCAACEARGCHPNHYVLRVPGGRPHAETQALLSRIRRQLQAAGPDNAALSDSVKLEVKLEMDDPLDPGPDPLQHPDTSGRLDKEGPTRTSLETFKPVLVDTEQMGDRSNTKTGFHENNAAVRNVFTQVLTEPEKTHYHELNEDDLPLGLLTEQSTHNVQRKTQFIEPIDHMPYKRENVDQSSAIVPQKRQYLDHLIDDGRIQYIDLLEKRQIIEQRQTDISKLIGPPKKSDPGSFGCEIYTHSKKCSQQAEGKLRKVFVPAGTVQKDVHKNTSESVAGTSQSSTMRESSINKYNI